MPEKQNVEYKESWRDEYLKWICGFANAQGGIIYIGKDDNGNTVGVADAKKLMEDIPNKVKNFLGIIVDVNLEIENNCEYIEIEVDPQPYPVSYKGEYHYRSGSTKQQLVGQQLNQFLLKKTGLTWDEEYRKLRTVAKRRETLSLNLMYKEMKYLFLLRR